MVAHGPSGPTRTRWEWIPEPLRIAVSWDAPFGDVDEEIAHATRAVADDARGTRSPRRAGDAVVADHPRCRGGPDVGARSRGVGDAGRVPPRRATQPTVARGGRPAHRPRPLAVGRPGAGIVAAVPLVLGPLRRAPDPDRGNRRAVGVVGAVGRRRRRNTWRRS